MCRAIVHNPEDATGVVIRRSGHHLLDEPVKGCDAILGFTTAKDSGAVEVQRGNIGPGTATEVLMLDLHGSARQLCVACLRRRAWMLVFSSAEITNSSFCNGLPCHHR